MLVDCQEAEVIGVDIDAVVFGERECRLELSRQVGAAVDRLDIVGLRRDVLVARRAAGERLLAGVGVGQPDLVVGPRSWCEVPGELIDHHLHLIADGVAVDRRRAAHDVSLHIAAGGERGELVGMDPLHEVPEVALDHAVVLDRLAGREPDRAIAKFIAHVDRRQELVGRELSAGHARADHERDLALALGALAGLAGFAVILLVGAVVLEQLHARLAEARARVGEFLRDVALEVVARGLGDLHGRGFGDGGRTGWHFVRHGFLRHDWIAKGMARRTMSG